MITGPRELNDLCEKAAKVLGSVMILSDKLLGDLYPDLEPLTVVSPSQYHHVKNISEVDNITPPNARIWVLTSYDENHLRDYMVKLTDISRFREEMNANTTIERNEKKGDALASRLARIERVSRPLSALLDVQCATGLEMQKVDTRLNLTDTSTTSPFTFGMCVQLQGKQNEEDCRNVTVIKWFKFSSPYEYKSYSMQFDFVNNGERFTVGAGETALGATAAGGDDGPKAVRLRMIADVDDYTETQKVSSVNVHKKTVTTNPIDVEHMRQPYHQAQLNARVVYLNALVKSKKNGKSSSLSVPFASRTSMYSSRPRFIRDDVHVKDDIHVSQLNN